MKLLLLITACVAALFHLDCRKQTGSSPDPNPRETVAPLPFTPPADSAIAVPQFQAWFACNGELDSLSIRFSEPLASADPAIIERYQKTFSAAQDSICVKNGLPAGYKEYRWIMDNMGGSRNKGRFDSIKAQQSTASTPGGSP